MNQQKISKIIKESENEFQNFIKKLHLQAIETAEERIPLYLKVGVKDADAVLDVGCGSGIVTRDIAHLTAGMVVGIDESKDMVDVAKKVLIEYENVNLQVGNADQLPFKDNSFDITICNLVLMWAQNPQQVVFEMARVTKKNGMVLASLEPDYGGKLHYPEHQKNSRSFLLEFDFFRLLINIHRCFLLFFLKKILLPL